MAKRIKLAVAVALVVSAIPTGRWAWHTRPWESPLDRAYRLCGECGLDTAKIDWLIGVMQERSESREVFLDVFRRLFDDPLDLEYCEPCADAVLDAAGNEPP